MFHPERETRWDYQPVRDLPALFEDSIWNSLPSGIIRETTTKYVRAFAKLPPGIAPIYLGRVCTGKSRAAAVLALAFAKYHVGTEWVNCPERFPMLARTKFAEETDAILRRWKRIPVLILDDFLVGASPFVPELIWARHAGQLHTIMTANLVAEPGNELEVVAATFGDAGPGLVHRLEAMTGDFGAFTS